MMKRIIVLVCLIAGILFSNSCSNQSPGTKEIEFNKKAELKLEQKLTFNYSDSFYVGNIQDIEVISGRIYISDKITSQIHKFDNNLNYIKSSPGLGKGPGEFTNPPYLLKRKDTLLVYVPADGIQFLDSNFIKTKVLYPPAGVVSDFVIQPLFFENRICTVSFGEIRNQKKDWTGVTAVALWDYNGAVFKKFCRFGSDINVENWKRFSRHALISNGFNNSILVQSMENILQYDEEGKLIKSFHYKPRYFKQPDILDLNISQEKKDEYYNKVVVNTTLFWQMVYLKDQNLVIINYLKSRPERMYSRSFTDCDSYLIVIDQNWEAVFDEQIDGYLAAVDGKYIYTNPVETEKGFVINKYSLVLE